MGHAEYLAGHLGDEQVGGVVARGGHQVRGLAHAALLQHLGALAVAGDDLAVEVVAQGVQGVFLHVHGNDVVARARERPGHGRAEHAASHAKDWGPLRHSRPPLRSLS